jgi:hypothetical protein
LIVQGDFTLVLQAYIYHDLIKLTPYYLFFLYHSALFLFHIL